MRAVENVRILLESHALSLHNVSEERFHVQERANRHRH